MSDVFKNIDPPPLLLYSETPTLSSPGECVHSARGEDTLAGWRGGGGSIFRKTPDTALYSTYVSTLRYKRYKLEKLPENIHYGD
jgi:hypothetical protein